MAVLHGVRECHVVYSLPPMESRLNPLCIEIETIAKMVAQRGGGLVEFVEKQKHNDQFQGNVIILPKCEREWRPDISYLVYRYGAFSHHPAQAGRSRLTWRDYYICIPNTYEPDTV